MYAYVLFYLFIYYYYFFVWTNYFIDHNKEFNHTSIKKLEHQQNKMYVYVQFHCLRKFGGWNVVLFCVVGILKN